MNTVFDQVAAAVREAFPSLTVRLEQVPDSQATKAVAVYGAPPQIAPRVRDLIHDLDWRLCMPTGCGVLAIVIEVDATLQYYPDLMPLSDCTAEDTPARDVREVVGDRDPGWSSCDLTDAAVTNDDLALAA